MAASTAGPPVIVSAPVPQPPAFNITTVAQEVPPAVEENGGLAVHWLNGVYVYSYPSTVGAGIDPCNLGTNRAKDEGDEIVNPVFGVFTGYEPVTCTALNLTWDEFKQRANDTLSAIEPSLLEKQLAAGRFKMDNPFLADANADALHGGTAVSAKEGLALLENAIGVTARAGVIHGDPATVAEWSYGNLLEGSVSGQLRTKGGTPVIRGTGYIGVNPIGGSAAGATQSWAWATGPILFQRGPITQLPSSLKEALDRSDNSVTYRAERDLLVAWDQQLQAAVLIDRSIT